MLCNFNSQYRLFFFIRKRYIVIHPSIENYRVIFFNRIDR
ncbi:unnamed protein product [Acanthoscelides obtectus]|uniref:Uncharacterized protein n=1 Tax=Acanthoscelides obtectus TaxID=200917 RepID=A0A9P0QGF2_ACAOB|nr:unnamed protein product [Acanthoscelides obtectus]CAH2020088.1 unnamed protein product [Acanthoscelides obtectus]CAH2020122.1 unnamed protein product [Acanthoscelides obtectus]CAK1682763.1 hypothetical protein AOBTE_LOCUS33861 [Acanthoscelides obtectus]CAK1682928.1 hypothetical protein AOBTE_LOCUS33999 [Acanthoscelides obtectus]